MPRRTLTYCKFCDTDHGLYNARGDAYDKCPRCGRKKPSDNEPEWPPLDDWNKHEMERNPLEML